jgi:hypothetical protein
MSAMSKTRTRGHVLSTKSIGLISTLLMLLIGVASAAFSQTYQYGDYPVTPVHFPAGKTTTTIQDSVERGASATYTFIAREGQHADIQLTTEEDNASFIFYMPGATISKSEAGYDVSGPTLPSAGLHARATRWSGRLPVSGKYTLTIQPSRGGATYHLTVTIK